MCLLSLGHSTSDTHIIHGRWQAGTLLLHPGDYLALRNTQCAMVCVTGVGEFPCLLLAMLLPQETKTEDEAEEDRMWAEAEERAKKEMKRMRGEGSSE